LTIRIVLIIQLWTCCASCAWYEKYRVY